MKKSTVGCIVAGVVLVVALVVLVAPSVVEKSQKSYALQNAESMIRDSNGGNVNE